VARWFGRCVAIASSSVAARPPPELRAFMPLTSPPAQKPWPAPVSTTTFTAGSSSAAASWRPSAWFIASLMALRAAGRFSVIVSTPPSRSASRSSVPVSIFAMAGSPFPRNLRCASNDVCCVPCSDRT
jgi:hypothetical protein